MVAQVYVFDLKLLELEKLMKLKRAITIVCESMYYLLQIM
jgi:hypothetical protein